MRLDDPASPSPGAVRAVKLQDPAEPAVLACSREHRAVLLHGFHSLAEVADVVQGIKNTNHINAVLNGLFAELLRQMGYEVTEYFGRWLLGESAFPARRHRILDVTAEGKRFIADVGVGCVCPLEPLEFELAKVQEREGRNYRIIRADRLGYVIQTDLGEGFVNFYSFTEDPQWTVDFQYVHYYCATHPDSIFAKMAKIHIFTETGRNSIMDEVNKETGKVERVARLSRPGGMEKFIIRDEQELYQVLKQDFNVEAAFLKTAD